MNTDIKEEIISLLSRLGPGKMSPSAYDTAWVARLGDIDPELSGRALEWLCQHQLPDGSWGAEQPFYYHDRVISTLSAMIALASQKNRRSLRRQIEKGLVALEWITERATKGLLADPNGATVGFEMIVPTLVAEAEKLGLIKQQGERILGRIARLRQEKLAKIEDQKINRYVTMAFSAEMAGTDFQELLDVENLQEANGSIGHSPSATAYFACHVRPKDESSLAYLRRFVTKSGWAPNLIPFDVFERSWVLWNLSIADSWDDETDTVMCSIVDLLSSDWKRGQGIGLSAGYSIPDGDDTALVFEVLSRFGYHPGVEALFLFEGEKHFRTYHLEADSSNSVNIHMLGAFRQANFQLESGPVQKTMAYLVNSMVEGAYWFDKWHLSPYYPTAHAVVACAGYANSIVVKSIEWILGSQKEDGSWGFQNSTAEETAYCIQALQVWRQNGGQMPKDVVKKALSWLEQNTEPPYPPLWIGKGLYNPEIVVRSAVLSALRMARQG
ncbi:MAG: cyclase [Chloroflexota bacterium]